MHICVFFYGVSTVSTLYIVISDSPPKGLLVFFLGVFMGLKPVFPFVSLAVGENMDSATLYVAI